MKKQNKVHQPCLSDPQYMTNMNTCIYLTWSYLDSLERNYCNSKSIHKHKAQFVSQSLWSISCIYVY